MKKIVENIVRNKRTFILLFIIVLCVLFFRRILFLVGILKQQPATIKNIDQEISKVTVRPTLTDTGASIIADNIYQLVGEWVDMVWDKGGKVLAEMTKINNDADFLLVVKAYGVRGEKIIGFGNVVPKTLTQILRDELKQSSINEINKLYASKGITYRI